MAESRSSVSSSSDGEPSPPSTSHSDPIANDPPAANPPQDEISQSTTTSDLKDGSPSALDPASRAALQSQAKRLQLNLLEIAESIDLVKADHEKLEKQNLALQDYIGGLTRSMSKGAVGKSGKGKGKKG